MFGMSRGPRPPVGPEAAWISIDPRTGELSQYPTTAERRIEQAYHHGERQVRLSGLGLHPVYETLVVDLGGPGESPVQKRVGGGKWGPKREKKHFEFSEA